MFAILAAVCFLLTLLKADIGVNLLVLGWLFVAIHLFFDWRPWVALRQPHRHD